jgi:hypothetical protein
LFYLNPLGCHISKFEYAGQICVQWRVTDRKTFFAHIMFFSYLLHGYADCKLPIHFSETDCPHFFHFRAAPYCQIQKFECLVFDFDPETTHCNAHSHGMKTEQQHSVQHFSHQSLAPFSGERMQLLIQEIAGRPR